MREILPGLYHWETFHASIGTRVSSYYAVSAAVLIDPKVPEGGVGELPCEPQQIVLTSGNHQRDSAQLAELFGIPVRVSQAGAERLAGQFEVVPFGDGDKIAPGVTAIHIDKLSDDEDALHLDVGDGALVFGDGLQRYAGALGFFQDELLGDDPERVKGGLRDAFHGLLIREFDTLLFAHGEPLTHGGKAALRRFLENPVGHESCGQFL